MDVPNVLGLPVQAAESELAALGYTVRLVPCDDSPPDGGDSERIVRQDVAGETAVLTYGIFKTKV